LTALASLQCDDDTSISTESSSSVAALVTQNPQLAKGRALGEFRSWGQLGRAIGPILACASYWTAGPTITYGTCGFLMLILATHMRRMVTGKLRLELSASNMRYPVQKRKTE